MNNFPALFFKLNIINKELRLPGYHIQNIKTGMKLVYQIQNLNESLHKIARKEAQKAMNLLQSDVIGIYKHSTLGVFELVLKINKHFEKTGQYYFDLNLGLKQGGLAKWFNENWVDISAPKKGGGYKECGRKSANGSKRGYPKCVPAAKAARMSESQKRSAVIRKRSVSNAGPKPTNVK